MVGLTLLETGEPVTDPKFKSPSAKEPIKFLMQNHPEVIKPLAELRVGPSLTQVVISNSSDFGYPGMAFIGAAITLCPTTPLSIVSKV